MPFNRTLKYADSHMQNSVFTKGALVIIVSLGMFSYLAFYTGLPPVFGGRRDSAAAVDDFSELSAADPAG